MTLEDEFAQTASGGGEWTWGAYPGGAPAVTYPDGKVNWRSSTGGTDMDFTTGVADPTFGDATMLKIHGSTSGSKKTAGLKSLWIDQNTEMAAEAKGVYAVDLGLYFSDESMVDGGYFMLQLTPNGSSAFISCIIKPDGLYRTLSATTPSYAMSLPRNEWLKLIVLIDYDSSKWSVSIAKTDGTVLSAVISSSWPAPQATLARTRMTYVDTVSELKPSTWMGMDYFRYYKLSASSAYQTCQVTGEAGVGKTIGVIPQFEGGSACDFGYQWCRAATDTAYSSLSLTDIAGATGSTYTATAADLYSFLFVKLTVDTSSLYPGWPDIAIGTYPEAPDPKFAVEAEPFIKDFGAETEGTIYYNTANTVKDSHFYTADWNTCSKTDIEGGVSAITTKSAGGEVKKGALEVSLQAGAATNFWMAERHTAGGRNDNVIRISQEYYIPSGEAFAEGSNTYMVHVNRLGKTEGDQLNAYTFKQGKIYAINQTDVVGTIPYDEWFTVEEVYFVRGGILSLILTHEDGTRETLLLNKTLNATVCADLTSGGYRRTRAVFSKVTADSVHMYFGKFTVSTAKDFSAVPRLTVGATTDEIKATADVICANYDTPQSAYTILCAQYRDGRLVAVRKADKTGDGTTAVRLAFNVRDFVTVEGDTIKAFIYDGTSSLKPLAASAAKTVTQ